MKNFSHFIIISFLFFISFDAQSSMVIKDIKKPIFVMWINDHEYVIGGKNGCIRGSYDKNEPLADKKTIVEEQIDYISINKNKTLLGISLVSQDREAKQVLCNLKQNSVSNITFSDCFCTPTVFSTTHNFLLACEDGRLIQYDCINNTIKENEIPYSKYTLGTPLLEPHPINNQLLYKSGGKKFTIINITNPLNIQKTIVCDQYIQQAQYASNGEFIAIESQNDQYFICALNTNKNNIDAHVLMHDNKEYIACAFHPKESIIALLSDKAHIHYFNYITMQCIANIQTTSEKSIFSIKPTNRLDICPQGKKLIAALNDECNIIDVPQNNLLDVYKWLLRKEIPTELRKYIFSLLIPLYSKNFSYFDLNALLHVEQIENIGKNESDNIEQQKKEKTIYVKLIDKKIQIYHISNFV